MNVCLGRVHAASYNTNRIGGVMVRVLASSAVDRGFNANSAIFQLYHGENKLIFSEMMMRSALY
jgi:hypothetical protein